MSTLALKSIIILSTNFSSQIRSSYEQDPWDTELIQALSNGGPCSNPKAVMQLSNYSFSNDTLLWVELARQDSMYQTLEIYVPRY